LNGKTPTVNGNAPGTFSFLNQVIRSPQSSKEGNLTFGIFNPDNEVVLISKVISLSRTLKVNVSLSYVFLVSSQDCNCLYTYLSNTYFKSFIFFFNTLLYDS